MMSLCVLGWLGEEILMEIMEPLRESALFVPRITQGLGELQAEASEKGKKENLLWWSSLV